MPAVGDGDDQGPREASSQLSRCDGVGTRSMAFRSVVSGLVSFDASYFSKR
jgi:hypothetical protein